MLPPAEVATALDLAGDDGPGGPPFEYCRTLFRADRVHLDVDLAEVMAAGGLGNLAPTHSPVPQHPSSGR